MHGVYSDLKLPDFICVNVAEKDKQREIRDGAIIKTQKKATEKAEAKALRIQQEKKYTLEAMMKVGGGLK